MIRDDRDVERKGATLEGKTIDVVVAAGIAAIETPKFIRELRRYGARVRVFMTPNATEFVRPLVFEWASKSPVITELSGSAEHITHSDAVVVAPATLDFMSKIALGLADSAAATLVQSALSRIPVIFAPSMHSSLRGNPIFEQNLQILRDVQDVSLLECAPSEGKAKMIDFESLAAEVCHRISKSKLSGIPVTISFGPTRSYADDMRFLSNRSTGALGVKIADQLFRMGARVTAICGPTELAVPTYLNPERIETNDEMRQAFQAAASRTSAKVAIFCAAVLDFDIANPARGKNSSRESWELKLVPSSKLIQGFSLAPNLIRVGFKLESKISVDQLKEKARGWMRENPCELLVANRLEDVGKDLHKAYIFSARDQSVAEASSKQEIAEKLAELLSGLIKT